MEAQNQEIESKAPVGQLAVFRVDEMRFGVEVLAVQEVIKFIGMTQVPLADAAVKGLINLRGQIITAIDLRTMLGVKSSAYSKEPMNIVLQVGQSTLSLLVDEIEDVIVPDPSKFEDIPKNISPECSKLLKGVYKLNVGLLLILDPTKVVKEETEQ
jgi:purine-binding chemotaxis protein CheW